MRNAECGFAIERTIVANKSAIRNPQSAFTSPQSTGNEIGFRLLLVWFISLIQVVEYFEHNE
jgi:hypothetical protein